MSEQIEYFDGRRQVIDFLEDHVTLSRIADRETDTIVAPTGVIELEFAVPSSVRLTVFKQEALMRAQAFSLITNEWRLGGRNFNSDDPLVVHKMIATHKWNQPEARDAHVLRADSIDRNAGLFYSVSFLPEEIGHLVINPGGGPQPLLVREEVSQSA